MLFRDFKTGLAIGLTALLFSSGAGAGTLGGAPSMEDDPETRADDRLVVSRLFPQTIATEIYGGSVRENSGLMLEGYEDRLWLMPNNRINYETDITLTVNGAEIAGRTGPTIAAKTAGVVILTSNAETPSTEDPAGTLSPLDAGVPLYTAVTAADGTPVSPAAYRALLWEDLVDDDGNLRTTGGTPPLPTFVAIDGMALSTIQGMVNMTATDVRQSGWVLSDFRPSLVPHHNSDAGCSNFRFRTDSSGEFPACGAEGVSVAAYHIEGLVITGTHGMAEPGSTISVETAARDQ